MNNNYAYQFGIYNPDADSIIVNLGDNEILDLIASVANSYMRFSEPEDIDLSRLAEENPLSYAKLALKH